MNDRFQFLKTYLDSLEKLSEADQTLAKDLAWRIIQYGIKGEDKDSGNPIIEAMFVQIKLMIDNGIEITNRNRENGKKGGRPIKTWDNSQKPNLNPTQTQPKPNTNPNETETKPKKTKIENIKYKKENILSLSKDNEVDKSTKEYGNSEINKCLDLIRKYNNGLIDGTKQNQRRFGKHLINKLKELDSIKEGRYTREETLEIILKIISQNKFYVSKITSPELIYRNLAILMQQCKQDIAKSNNQSTVLESI